MAGTRIRRCFIGICFLFATLQVSPSRDAASTFADQAFDKQWRQGEAIAMNFWGPLANAKDSKQEEYKESPGGKRLVQYFDKGRMELTNGAVTNGLLATEITAGKIQTGDATFRVKAPPAIPVAGDPDNSGPTYAGLADKGGILFTAATNSAADKTHGNLVAARVAADGSVMTANPVSGTGATATVVFDSQTKHNVPMAFAEYREKAGLSTIGLAITEPFLTTVKVAGQSRGVMVQVFERRVLTYTADNPDAFKVEMGNIGQHYYAWRYADATADDAIRPWTAGYLVGNNYGYQDGWDNGQFGDLSVAIGQMTTRYSLPQQYLQQKGIAAERAYLDHMKAIGMHDLVCFLSIPADGDETKVTPPADLYQPIFANGQVNAANSWATYVASVVREYGDIIKVWEVWNEPDFTADNTLGVVGGAWQTRQPKAGETPNWKGGIPQYVRMLRITYEVVHALQPEAYVATGGITYEAYLDWILKLTDNPDGGKVSMTYPLTGGAYFDVLSFHQYPIYAEQDWAAQQKDVFLPTGTTQGDLANWSQKVRNLTYILAQRGYDGSRHPAKIFINTETGVPWEVANDPSTGQKVDPASEARRAAGTATGQISLAKQLGVVEIHFYQLNDLTKPTVGLDDAFNHMGMYKYLLMPGQPQTLSPIGAAVKAVLRT